MANDKRRPIFTLVGFDKTGLKVCETPFSDAAQIFAYPEVDRFTLSVADVHTFAVTRLENNEGRIFSEEIGAVFKAAREMHNISIEKVAEYIGATRTDLTAFEEGERKTSLRWWRRRAKPLTFGQVVWLAGYLPVKLTCYNGRVFAEGMK